jgi:hypothetical protein
MNTFKRFGLKLIIHENRIEVREGWLLFIKRQTIPLKNVASVEVSRFTKQLVVQTNDGKKHAWAIGGFGKAQRARDAIVAAM